MRIESAMAGLRWLVVGMLAGSLQLGLVTGATHSSGATSTVLKNIQV